MSSGSHAAPSDPRLSGTASLPSRRSTPVSIGRRIYDWIILLLLAASSIAGIWIYGGIAFEYIAPLMAGVYVAAALFLARPLFFAGTSPSPWPPAILGLLVFALYGFARIPQSAAPYFALLAVVVIVSVIAALVVWSGLASDSRGWRWLFAALLLSITVMAWYAIIQNAHGSTMVLNYPRPTQYGMRASGAYFCPNHFANVLAITVPMAIALAAMPAARAPLRLLAGYSVLVILPPLYLSGSRSAWLGLLVGILVVCTLLGLRRGFRRALLMLLIAVLAVAVLGVLAWFFLPLVQTRVLDALHGNVRINLWRDTLTMIQTHPWFGYGPGSFRWVYPGFWHHLAIYIDPEHAHNDYLQLLAEFGIVGAVLLVAAISWLVVRLLSVLKKGAGDRSGYLAAGFIGALTAYIVHAAFDYNFHLYSNVHVLAAYGGIAISVIRANGEFSSFRPAMPVPGGRWHALWALVPLLFALLTVRAIAANVYLMRGDELREASQFDEAIDAYRSAQRIEPRNGDSYRGLAQCRSVQAFWNLDRETKLAQAEEAQRGYRKALELNPWDTGALFGLARIQDSLGNPEEAVAALTKLVDMIPHEPEYQIELGLQLRSMQRYREALEVFERVQKKTNNEMVRLNLDFLRRKLAE